MEIIIKPKLLLILTVMLSLTFFAKAQTVNPLWVDGKLYIQLYEDAVLPQLESYESLKLQNVDFLDGLVEQYGITKIIRPFKDSKSVSLQRIVKLEFSMQEKISSLIAELNKRHVVRYAEPAPLFFISSTPPNDTYYNKTLSGGFLGSANSSWHLNLINAEQAWNVTEGDPNIIVAVLDNAIWIDHPDLVNKIHSSKDLGNNDDDPNPPQATYIWSHGTHSAGLIGAETNNNLGIASIGNKIKIMAIKLGDDASDGQSMAAGYEGVVWAADHGAHVINMSWGTPQFFQTMQTIVNYAYNKGCVLVGAAGNNGNGAETQMNPNIPRNYVAYPASLNHVIAVGSCNTDDKKSDFSNYGTWIDLLSPGGYATQGVMGGFGAFSVLSTTYNDCGNLSGALNGSTGGAGSFTVSGKYDLMQGTSMAAPVCSGLCGLMLSANPQLTPEELVNMLKATCVNVNSQNAAFIDSIGSGRIDAFAAVTAAHNAISALVADFTASNVSIPVGGGVTFTDASFGSPTSWSWEFEGGTPATSNEQNPTVYYNEEGVYKVKLTVSDGTNTDTELKTTFILVGQRSGLAQSAWIEQHTRFASQYRGVYKTEITDANSAWVLTYNGAGGGGITRDFARTIDGGTTWIPDTIDIDNAYSVGDISAISGTTAWIATYKSNGGGAIFKTTNGGDTWTAQSEGLFTGSSSFLNVINMFNENEGYCQGDPVNNQFEMYRTTDGGTTWTAIPSSNLPTLLSGEAGWTGVRCSLGDNAWFGTNKGRVYKSTDKGQTWTAYATGKNNVSKLSFSDENNGIALCVVANQQTGAITSWNLIKTADGGATWSDINVESQYISDLSAVPGSPGMLVAIKVSQNIQECFSAYSYDYGTTWTMLDDSVQYTNVEMFSNTIGWAGGFNMDANNGGIYKWAGPASSTSPYFTSAAVTTVVSGQNYTYNVVAVDPNSETLTMTAETKPEWLSITDNGNGTAVLSGIAPQITTQFEDFNVSLKAANSSEFALQNYVIRVLTSNRPPVFTSEPVTTTRQHEVYTYNVTTSDPDGGTLTITSIEKPEWLTLTDNGDGTALLTGTPTVVNAIGYAVSLRVSDGMFSAEQTFRLKVTGISNRPPVFTSEPVLTNVVNTEYVYNITGSDPDDNSLTFTARILPSWATFVDNGDGTAKISGTPTELNEAGEDVKIQLSDGSLSVYQTFKVSIVPVNVENIASKTLNIYPNPAYNTINISNAQDYEYQISDNLGRIIKQGKINNDNESIDISNIAQSYLFMKLINNNTISTIKIVKISD